MISKLRHIYGFYSASINTYRIVTINKKGNPYVLTSLLRVGTSTSGNVDKGLLEDWRLE